MDTIIHSEISACETQGGRLLRRGDTCDIGCWRTTHRLGLALSILAVEGIKPEWPQHAEACGRHPDKLANVAFGWRQRVVCTCEHRNGPHWPAYATGKMFDLAYRLADEFQTERGAWHQRKINEARRGA